MDPASIIGTTSAVLSFVGFIFQTISVTRELHDAGKDGLDEHNRFKEVTSSLRPGLSKLKEKVDEKGEEALSVEEKSKLRVATQCEKVGDMILDHLDRYTPTHKSLSKAREAATPSHQAKMSWMKRVLERIVSSKETLGAALRIVWYRADAEEMRMQFNICTI